MLAWPLGLGVPWCWRLLVFAAISRALLGYLLASLLGYLLASLMARGKTGGEGGD